MIKYSDIPSILEPLGIRVEEFSIRNQDEDIEPYFLVYAITETESKYADGINYINILHVKAFLDVDDLHDEVIQKLESILTSNGVSYTKSVEYIHDDRLFEFLYEFVVADE